jgi:hypothetical protein
MMRALVLTLLLAACATRQVVTLQHDAPPAASAAMILPHAIAGERMEYEVTALGTVFGRIQTGVGVPGLVDGRPTLIVRSRGSTTGVLDLLGQLNWEMTTTIDLAAGYAVYETEDLTTTRRADGQQKRYHADRPFALSAQYHNAHSAIGVLRGWRSQVGDELRLDVHFGDDLLVIELRDVGREIIGTTPAVRYEGRAGGKWALTGWVSDDADRVPLRLRTETVVGAIQADLVRYE